MISAPIIPRTRDSLWDLLEAQPERIERGFSIVSRDLLVRDHFLVDAIGRDASGRLTLLFVTAGSTGSAGAAGSASDSGEDGDELTQRIFFGHQWVRRNERVLLNALPDSGLRAGDSRASAGPRVIVVGFAFDESMVETLGSLPVAPPDLLILRCEAFVLDGNLHAGLSAVGPLVRGAADLRPHVDARAGAAAGEVGGERLAPHTSPANAGSFDTFELPPDVVDTDLRRVGEEIITVLTKLDPNLQVQGDRFSRRFYSTHGLLAELYVNGDRLFFVGADADGPRPVRASDAREIADSLVRTYLELMTRPAQAAERDHTLRATLADGYPSRGGDPVDDSDSPRDSRATPASVRRSRLRIDHALHPLPRSPLVDDTEVSQEEFDAFSGLTTEQEDS